MRKLAFLPISFVVMALVALMGCGRSGLGDELLSDGGLPDGGGCSTSPDDCPSGELCDPTTHACVPGCRSDADCHAPTSHCRTDVHVCAECLDASQCPSGELCQNFKCVAHCGPADACGAGLACCATFCIDESSDPRNCGGCGVSCGPYPRATSACTGKSCAIGKCNAGFADCDRVVTNGCETNVASDPAHCGGCGTACPPGDTCSGGVCAPSCGGGGACPSGLSCCGTSCASTSGDPKNCGACGNSCGSPPHASATCSSSKCAIAACDPGFGDCNGVFADGCEVDFASDASHCGSCSGKCAPTEACSGGTCAGACGTTGCSAGLTCCGKACDDLANDAKNCGGCGNVCPTAANATIGCGGSKCRISSCNSGFADCDLSVGDGCEIHTDVDPANCGACGRACAPGQTCSFGVCTGGGCRATGCASGQSCCGDVCVDTKTDLKNCGGCFTPCPADSTSCEGGGCCKLDPSGGKICSGMGCTGGLTICSGKCIDLKNDPANCGFCGVSCPTGDKCVGGVCALGCGGLPCGPGTTCCKIDGGISGCFDTTGDPKRCGGCFVACPVPSNASSATCVAASCGFVCSSGFGDCDGIASNGCEASLSSDRANCGACGKACGASETCSSGVCTPTCACAPPRTCCGGGTTCIDPTSDPSNCGGCGTVCPTPSHSVATCGTGTCGYACTGAFLDCNGAASDGCEVDGSSDASNCGKCGVACPTGKTCSGGVCGGVTEGPFDPIVNPTFLSPGIHNFTTINIPAGVVVYVAGSGPASGTLDLRASGDVKIDGIIDVSGGPGSQNTITSTSTQSGRAGSGGFTGELKTSAASLACQFVVGNPGVNGSGPAGTIGTCPAGPKACIGPTDPLATLFAAPAAIYGGGAGVFTGYRAYGSGGGGPAGGAPGALGAAFTGEPDCSGASGGGGATAGKGGVATGAPYDGANGILGQTQCAGLRPGVPAAYVGGGGGGSIGAAASADLAVATTFIAGSGGGGGSGDYEDRPVYGGTSGGGGGGGALKISSGTSIVINGQLLAKGGDGGDAFIGNGSAAGCDPQPGAAGGGGSGGVIYLAAPSLTVSSSATISTAGGVGGFGSLFATGGGGGNGGLGRIRLSATPASCSLAGTFDPPLSSGCTPAALPGKTYVAVYPG